MTSLAQKISSYKATCNWTEPIRLSNRFECLEIQCGAEETGRTFTNKCDQMSHAAIADEHWFISTQFIAAQDPFRESVCQVGLATARLQDPQRHHYYNLLYLDAIVCDEKTGRNQSRSSCTKDTALHQTVRYPFHYDPESIALNHPRPFSVWRIGLYLDPRSRIAVTISTIKPLTVNHCSRNSSEFEQAHKEFFLPEFDM